MSDAGIDRASTAPALACSHPWLVVRCGACGAALEEVGSPSGQPAAAPPPSASAGIPTEPSGPAEESVFIVARGQRELLDELRTLLGSSGSVRVIEDRRRAPRLPTESEVLEAQILRSELRRRVLGARAEPPG